MPVIWTSKECGIQPCWNCHSDSFIQKVDKQRPGMVHYECIRCGATTTGIKPKRRK